MNASESVPLSRGKRFSFSLLNILIPGLGFLFKRNYKAAALNFLGFALFLVLFPFIVGHENQSAVPWGYVIAMLGSGLACWGEPL